MLQQLLRTIAALKLRKLQAQQQHNQQQIQEIDRAIAAQQAEIDRLRAKQKALFEEFN